MTAPLRVGAHSGWHLDFRKGPADTAERVRAFGSSDYYASIDATLPAGLDGGSYTFVIEGMPSEHYADLYRVLSKEILVVRLHLYWRDADITSYFVDLAGLTDALDGDDPPAYSLVAVLRVTTLQRRAGSRRYEVVIEAHEWVYDRALERITQAGQNGDPLAAAQAIAEDKNVGIDFTPLGVVPAPADGDALGLKEWSFAAGDVAAERLRELGTAMARLSNKFGLDMYLIRNGALFAGPDRHLVSDHHDLTPDPTLGPDPGLFEIQSRGQESTDPNFVPDQATPGDREPTRDLFELTLRGRPDIKPGDFVDFVKPAEETDVAGTPTSFSIDVLSEVKPGATARMYVRGVAHRLSRDKGFITTLRGFSVPGEDDDSAWFHHSPPKGPTTQAARVTDDSPEGALAGTFHELLDKSGGERIDVAQVRGSHVNDSKRPNQTEELWRGLATGDAKYAAARLPFDDTGMDRFSSAPYLSPFAWGKFGLVLPRYPGMRVLVGNRLGDREDIIDLGALWERGQAPTANPGDYWLILPAAIPAADRAQVAENEKPKDPSGKATNDLIDADGSRVIEVGTLTVRIGADHLASAGTRPSAATAPVHIEHTSSGSTIVIDQDGNITIEAKKALNLVAADDITLDTPKKVVVKVGQLMDVKAR